MTENNNKKMYVAEAPEGDFYEEADSFEEAHRLAKEHQEETDEDTVVYEEGSDLMDRVNEKTEEN